ncbi:hypothetical protein MPSI1_002742 [Malassezia psittaci]|uniref:Phospholipid/glycerol acyltransferase domain-containing protein n=1 Tax=Malassezia psittaci TaxID=1821823 RepID=A0AAF0FGG1_9BASI|nr:hypothetical protein MPSI1_002742 [Malassezia psittaci]
MKESLRRIPVLGYYMGVLQFFFLSRNWENDQARLKSTLQSILQTGPSKLALLLYPEGTNISRNTIRKSHQYSASHNKPMLQNVLLPHSTGLYFCTKTIQSKLPNTYILPALTSSHADCPPLRNPVADDLGNTPGPSEKQAFEDWLIQRWERKDALIRRFYRDRDFIHGRLRGLPRLHNDSESMLTIGLRPPSFSNEAKHLSLAPLGPLLAYYYCKLARLGVATLAETS